MTTTRSVVIEKEFPYPAEKIWRALTEGPLIKEWLMDNDLQPVVGHKFNFRATPMPHWNGIIDAEMLVVEPNKKLSYSWGSMGLESVVVWTLVATQAERWCAWSSLASVATKKRPTRARHYGWQKFIGGLERVVGGLS